MPGRTDGAERFVEAESCGCRDESPRGIAHQVEAFERVTRDLPGERSIANSAATLRHAERTRGDWVRPGIVLYGSSPDYPQHTAAHWGLQPTQTLSSRIIGVQQLAAGQSVGYGSRFTAEGPVRLGTVACGYADGYPRHAPTGTPVLVEGRRTRTLGRVSMDMLCVDLSALPGTDVGSSVTLWGAGLPVEEVARAAGTISYELLCALAVRVPVMVD